MTELKLSLHPGQSLIRNSEARFKVVAAGRRFGKSHYAAVELGIAALATENQYGHRLTAEHGVYYVAPTFDQAKRVMWPKLREIFGYAKHGGFIVKENTNEGWLELISGRRIYIKGADNPDSLRGIGLSFVVLDEYADMKADTWELIIRPALADVKGSALFIGTPKGKNHFYKLFINATDKPNPNNAEKNPWADWESFHFKSVDNPFIDFDEISSLANNGTMSREAVKQELEASFMSSGGKVLKPQWFEIVDRLPPNHVEGSFYVTVDLAGFSRGGGKKAATRTDETVICSAFCTSETWYIMDMAHGHWDVREVALRIIRACSALPGCQLGIEKGALMNAIGPYLEEEMRRFNRYVTPVPLSHGNQKKVDRIASALQGRAQRGRIKLLKDDAVGSKSMEPWNQHFLDQAADFPDPLSHDDMPDAMAYLDQIAKAQFASDADIVEWEALDLVSGY